MNEQVDFRYSTMPSVISDHFHVPQMSYWKTKITKLTFFPTFPMRKRDASYQWWAPTRWRLGEWDRISSSVPGVTRTLSLSLLFFRKPSSVSLCLFRSPLCVRGSLLGEVCLHALTDGARSSTHTSAENFAASQELKSPWFFIHDSERHALLHGTQDVGWGGGGERWAPASSPSPTNTRTRTHTHPVSHWSPFSVNEIPETSHFLEKKKLNRISLEFKHDY